ncbi:MAG: ThiF family adenylyltransferase [Gemmatimonadaceae bacterium]
MIMFGENPGDELHRVVKLAMDSGEAATVEEAMARFKGYRVGIRVGRHVARSPSLQAAVLTAVNTARRCFLGGVEVAGALDAPLLLPWPTCRTLGDAVHQLQGRVGTSLSPEIPCIQIGDAAKSSIEADDVLRRRFAVRATFDGWSGGVVPLASNLRLGEHQECTPAGVLAGALAVSEAFQFVRGGNPAAGRRDVGLSLWRPEPEVSWLESDALGPALDLLPCRLWLIGLGHLGQAYLWTLGLLPYADPAAVELMLQDFDTLTPANDSTSPLTTRALVGQKKARAMAAWCETRGFRSVITERRFSRDFRIASDEPQVALAGVDNALARSALEDAGFARVIEAGLGNGTTEYLAFQLHTFPGPQTARARWGRALEAASPSRLLVNPAYAALARAGVDECGLTLLAGRSVGASFVGTAAATLVVAEAMRQVMGGPEYSLIDGSLRTPARRTAVPHERGSAAFNPGYTRVSQ